MLNEKLKWTLTAIPHGKKVSLGSLTLSCVDV